MTAEDQSESALSELGRTFRRKLEGDTDFSVGDEEIGRLESTEREILGSLAYRLGWTSTYDLNASRYRYTKK